MRGVFLVFMSPSCLSPWHGIGRQKQFANLLAAAHGACLPQQKADNAAYDSARGKELIDQSKSITGTVAEVTADTVFAVAVKLVVLLMPSSYDHSLASSWSRC